MPQWVTQNARVHLPIRFHFDGDLRYFAMTLSLFEYSLLLHFIFHLCYWKTLDLNIC